VQSVSLVFLESKYTHNYFIEWTGSFAYFQSNSFGPSTN